MGLKRAHQALQLDESVIGDPRGLNGAQGRFVQEAGRRWMLYNGPCRACGALLTPGPAQMPCPVLSPAARL